MYSHPRCARCRTNNTKKVPVTSVKIQRISLYFLTNKAKKKSTWKSFRQKDNVCVIGVKWML